MRKTDNKKRTVFSLGHRHRYKMPLKLWSFVIGASGAMYRILWKFIRSGWKIIITYNVLLLLWAQGPISKLLSLYERWETPATLSRCSGLAAHKWSVWDARNSKYLVIAKSSQPPTHRLMIPTTVHIQVRRRIQPHSRHVRVPKQKC